jgi:hypothetical protein
MSVSRQGGTRLLPKRQDLMEFAFRFEASATGTEVVRFVAAPSLFLAPASSRLAPIAAFWLLFQASSLLGYHGRACPGLPRFDSPERRHARSGWPHTNHQGRIPAFAATRGCRAFVQARCPGSADRVLNRVRRP